MTVIQNRENKFGSFDSNYTRTIIALNLMTDHSHKDKIRKSILIKEH